MSAVIRTYNAPAATTYSASDIGKVVYESGAGEATISTNPAISGGKVPLGILVDTDGQAAGRLSVCVSGLCKALFGAAFTPGTSIPLLMANGSGKAIPATDGNYSFGRFAGKAAAADTHYHDVIVDISVNEIS